MSDIIVLTLWAKLLKRLKYWEQFLQLSGTSLSNKESSMSNRQSNPASWKYKALSSVFSRMVATTTRTSRTLHSNRQILQREKHVLHEVHPLTTFIQLILNQFLHERGRRRWMLAYLSWLGGLWKLSLQSQLYPVLRSLLIRETICFVGSVSELDNKTIGNIPWLLLRCCMIIGAALTFDTNQPIV